MAARSSGPRFLASNGTMHHAMRLERAKSVSAPANGSVPTSQTHGSNQRNIRKKFGWLIALHATGVCRLEQAEGAPGGVMGAFTHSPRTAAFRLHQRP